MTRTASDMVEMLRRHYQPEGRPPAGIFAPEIASPDGKRRADLIWMPTTIAGGRGLVGHEVKVSRSDVLTELADPTKADPWSKFCDRWWLVVSDPALVDGLTVPEAWGIMAPPSGRRTRSMTIVRPAPRLDPVDRARGVEKLAAWMLYRHHGVEAGLRREMDGLQRTIGYRDGEIRKLRAATVGHSLDPNAQRIGKILEILTAKQFDERIYGSIDEETIARVILDTEHARRAVETARHAMDSLERSLADPLRHMREQVKRIRSAVDVVPPPAEVAR